MNNSLHSSTQRTPAPGISPFAQALESARGGQGGDQFNDGFPSMENGRNSLDEQQRMLDQQKKERLRSQLHRQINPVEQTDIFNAKQAQVKKQIDDIRHELKLLSDEVEAFNKDVQITVMANVATPGTEGKYYFTFFQKLKEFIILLREKIHSARTWATTMSSKKKKRKGAGMEISGKSHEQTATVFDRMHHERSTVYSGS